MKDLHGCDDPWGDLDPSDFFLFASVSTFLVLFGGIMSGLQQGMMQLDETHLLGMERDGGRDKWKATWLLPLARRKHFTLVTLLISNAVAMEALPIFLDVLAPKYFAILLSVTLVVFFGEIIPQGMCLRYPTDLSANFAWLVYLLMALLSPIAYPISRLLDWMLGHDQRQLFSRAGLWELAQLHSRAQDGKGPLDPDEVDIITGALELHNKSAADCMTGLGEVFMLNAEGTLDDAALRHVLDHGYSRVPVYRGTRGNILGYILVKNLLRVSFPIPVAELQLVPIEVLRAGTSLHDVLKRLRSCGKHIAAVVDATDQEESAMHLLAKDAKVIGILTLEDVLEQLLKHTIEDETDVLIPLNHSLDDQLKSIHAFRDRMADMVSCDDTLPNEQTSLLSSLK